MWSRNYSSKGDCNHERIDNSNRNRMRHSIGAYLERRRVIMLKINKDDSLREQDFRGFCLSLSNGWNVSVQWGRGNYASHRHQLVTGTDRMSTKLAEVGIWQGGYGEMEVEGYCDADRVAQIITEVSSIQDKGGK